MRKNTEAQIQSHIVEGHQPVVIHQNTAQNIKHKTQQITQNTQHKTQLTLQRG